ncbi:Protein kinase alk2 [Boothiomyces macroporosus]|uniref:Protein kinase alk2 n=1 Tax=Boothiomyces macroporosus TaxID=261099 RepID=A0AAD5UCF6_9FUNG|nr:Protein kinase alk2 [Boothiomyces macroporosus]
MLFTLILVLILIGLLLLTFWDDPIASVKIDKSIPRLWNQPLIGGVVGASKNLERMNDAVSEAVNVPGFKVAAIQFPFRPPFVIINDPESLKHVLATNFENYVKGDFYYQRFVSTFGNGIFNSDGAHWLMQRKIGVKIFTIKTFRDIFHPVFSRNIQILSKILEEKAATGKHADMSDLFHKYFLDSFGRVAFGSDLNSLLQDHVPFAQAFDNAQEAITSRFYDPFWRINEKLNGDKVGKDIKLVRDFARNIVREAKKTEHQNEKTDLLAMFRAHKNEDGTILSDEELVDQVLNFLVAGRDTTAQALSWVIHELDQHPNVLLKIRQELYEIMANSEAPSYEQVKQMKYTKAVIFETLRLHPSVPRNIKLALNDDVLPNGVPIKAGVFIYWSTYAMGRNETIWKDPLDFKPERWLTGSQPSPFEFPSFNAGPRICLGKSLAEFQGVFALSCLLQKYDFKVIKPKYTEYMTALTLPMKYGLKVQVKERTQSEYVASNEVVEWHAHGKSDSDTSITKKISLLSIQLLAFAAYIGLFMYGNSVLASIVAFTGLFLFGNNLQISQTFNLTLYYSYRCLVLVTFVLFYALGNSLQMMIPLLQEVARLSLRASKTIKQFANPLPQIKFDFPIQ